MPDEVLSGRGPGYLEIMARTGVPKSRQTPGNLGFFVLQRNAGDHDEILTMSLWDSEDSVKAFAGDDISRAVFYPDDDAWLSHASRPSLPGSAG